MNATSKLALYGLAMLAVFGGSYGVGNAAEPLGLSTAEPVEHEGAMADEGAGLPGPASSAEGFTLETSTDTIAAGTPAPYSFTITGEDGVVTDFELEHTKPMHLIVVRRDFVGFIHDHPTMAADGTWSTTLTIDQPGAYRVFADFVVDGDKQTLGADLFAAGDFQPVPLPAPSATSDAGGGYEVSLSGDVIAGEESELLFTVRRHGEIVTDIPDYLGAKGHLVALRDGDLAYLHVHADEDRLVFEADFPTAGEYRLFLQFDHGGEIRTVAFTVNAQESNQ